MQIEPKPISREEITSWYLSSNTKIDETTFAKIGFEKFAHVEVNRKYFRSSFDIYHRPILRKNGLLLEIRYSFYQGYAGMFIIDEMKQIQYPIYENWNYFPNGRGFKLFLRHRVLKIQERMEAGVIPKRINKSWMFESDFGIITYY